MRQYRYEVKLIVEVDAFDEGDAWEAVQEHIGIGGEPGLVVIDCEYKEIK